MQLIEIHKNVDRIVDDRFLFKRVRFSQGLKVPLRGTFKPLRLNVRASHARLIIIIIDILYKDNWLKVPNI